MQSNPNAPEFEDSLASTRSIATRQRQCMHAFQTDRSWYQVYWYPEPQQRRLGIVGRTFPRLTVFLTSDSYLPSSNDRKAVMEDAPVSSLSVPYVLGGTLTEQQRLIIQARGLEAPARSLLDRICIKPGARAVDIGCGPIGILNLFSERVGVEGAVVGVEREARFVEMARAEVIQRGLRNVEVINADALKTGLQKNSYDVVHERLVLINLPAATQGAILAEMFSLLRPGGTIVLQEYDAISYVCHPEHPSWSFLLGIFNDTFHAAGGNDYIGRSLVGLLRSTGVEKVATKAHVGFPKVGEYQRTHLLSLVESMRDRVLATGRIGEPELRAHMDALSDHLSDPATTVIDKLMVQAWGQKPR